MLPELLTIGVPYDVFWYEDFDMIDAYVSSYKSKFELINQEAWLNGFYTHTAISNALSNAFRGKNQPPVSYLEKPLDLNTDKKKKRLSDAEIAYNKFRPFIQHFNNRRKGHKNG